MRQKGYETPAEKAAAKRAADKEQMEGRAAAIKAAGAKTEEEQNLKKCDDCKIKVATSHGASTEWGKFSLCESCYKKRNNKDKPVGDVKDFDEKWSKWTFSYENKKPINKLDSLEKIQQAKNELEPYLKTPDIINNSTSISRPDIQFFSPIPIKTNEDVNQVVNELTEMGIIKRKDDFMVLPDMEVVTVFFEKENNKEKVERVKDFIKILDWKARKFDKPTDKGKEPPKDDKNKPTDKDHKPNPNELCEQCGASCVVHKTKTSYTIKRKRYIKHKTDFTRESSVWFGTNCDCARQFREANQVFILLGSVSSIRSCLRSHSSIARWRSACRRFSRS